MHTGFDVGSSTENQLLLLRKLVDHGRVSDQFVRASPTSSSIVQQCGTVVNTEKLDLKPQTRGQYLRMLVDIMHEREHPTNSNNIKFQDVAVIPTIPHSSCQIVATASGPYGISKVPVKVGRLRMSLLQQQLRIHWLCLSDDLEFLVAILKEYLECIKWWIEGPTYSVQGFASLSLHLSYCLAKYHSVGGEHIWRSTQQHENRWSMKWTCISAPWKCRQFFWPSCPSGEDQSDDRQTTRPWWRTSAHRRHYFSPCVIWCRFMPLDRDACSRNFHKIRPRKTEYRDGLAESSTQSSGPVV